MQREHSVLIIRIDIRINRINRINRILPAPFINRINRINHINRINRINRILPASLKKIYKRDIWKI